MVRGLLVAPWRSIDRGHRFPVPEIQLTWHFSRTFCPLGRVKHEWFAKDAWVSESGLANCDPSCESQVA